MSEYCDYIENEVLSVLPSIYGRGNDWEVPDVELIHVCWKKVFYKTLDRWDWNDQTKDVLFEWGKYGYNWKHLHLTDEEENMSVRDAYRNFYGEIDYIYDRMSVDRLFRCHRLCNILIRKMKQQ